MADTAPTDSSSSCSSSSSEVVESGAPAAPFLAGSPSPGVPVLVEGVPVNGPLLDARAGEKFLLDVFPIIFQEAVVKGTDVNEKVCEWRPPAELRALLDVELGERGEPHQQLLQRCRDVIAYSVKTVHPRFYNQLFAGLDYHALAARWITEALNASVYTYEVAPVGVLLEEEVLKTLRKMVGWSSGDGIFCPGGSVSNMCAMNVARFRLCPRVKTAGLSALPRLVLFTSGEAHYSIQKAAAFLGIGTDNVRSVAVDERGKMIPSELERRIEEAKAEGAVPFMVVLTAGTTVLGAFDPIGAVADMCERRGLWLHVDASWGGSALLSHRHRHLLDGIHRVDSVAWNPHKMLMSGLQCCALLLRDDTGLLRSCHSASASYLFQTDKCYDSAHDPGDKSVQCGRRDDALKLWLTWKACGRHGLEARVDRAFACARYLADEIKDKEGFELLMEPEGTNVCFWFIPPSMRGQPRGQLFWQKLDKVAPAIKTRMMLAGSMMVGYQPHGDRVNFFRMILISPSVRREDLDFCLNEIERLGCDL